jgi:Na+-translocating ferredoxin:NAD+ oxidoreductase RnfA subunit
MMQGTGLIGAALIAVITERTILDPRIGKTPFSDKSNGFAQAAASGAAVLAMLVGGSALAHLFSNLVALPLNAAYLYGLSLITSILIIGLAGELLVSFRRPLAEVNRGIAKATAISAMIGLIALAPKASDHLAHGMPLERSVADAAAAGSVFLLCTLLYSGIRERFDFEKRAAGALLLARELAAAALLALALGSLATLHILG